MLNVIICNSVLYLYLRADYRIIVWHTRNGTRLIQGVVTAIPAVLTPATGIKILPALCSDLDRLIAYCRFT